MKTIEKKEPYLHTLNTRGNIYEEFLPDQVLTHKNLNKVVNYFEDQDRLSRVYLIGVGVGCGLDIVSYSNSHIEIGQGVGVTTDGDIIKTETRRFHYYSALTDRASYALFEGLQVYEIYEQEGAGRPNGELPLTSFTSNEPGTLKDYIVVAYVEDYSEDEGLCGGSGCDETGNKVYSNIKFLLIHKSNKSALVAEDTIYNSHDVLAYYDTMPELCMPRLLLNKDNTTSGIDIQDLFTQSYTLKNDLFVGIKAIIDNFKHRINFAKYGVYLAQITTYLDDIFIVQDESHIQYKYDLMKDLIDTYREIRELILFTRFECVANINAFPKHLLLGTLEEATRLQNRHEFYPSPTVAAENEDNLMAIRTLCVKFFNQLKEYNIPNVPTAAIKITPSKGYEFKLSERSIPYYYETKNSLISNWNPLSVQLRKAKNQLGYHVQNLKNIACVQKPLEYSHLDKDFYRIEGHIGKDFRLALRRINNLKAQYNLAFDVKAVSIGFPVNKVSLDDDTCNTKDYAILLQTWEQEFLCVSESASEFFAKYQYDDLGNNDTSTTIYTLATQQEQQVLQLLGRKKATEDTKNPDKIASRLTINTNTDSAEAVQNLQEARYSQSLQYAIDEAYSYVGTQDVAGLYLATVALGIIDQVQGTVDRGSDYFFYTEAPIKIIAGLADIKRNFIQSLDEIYVTEKWTALNNAIEALCSHIDQVLFAISEVDETSTFGTRTHDKMYEYFTYELSKLCCLKDKLAWLKEQIDEIRDNLYREVILSRLIEKHPGAEHMAGVPKGGTFLMVYLGGTEELLEDDSTLSRFNGTVQFDFALPYMCCSDCPPETIVYNVDPDVTLTIAKTKYCLPTDEGQQDFITSISNGVITSPQGDAFIVETETGYAFDPTGVSDELLGQPLTFLVNGTTPVVPLEICVYKLPSDITTTVEFLSWNETGINLDLNLSHELEALSYYSYVWNRADGSEIGTTKDILAAFFANSGETFQETVSVTISITDSPVPCTITTDLELDFSRPVANTVTVPPIICHRLMETSPVWTPVTVTPFGASLTSPQVPIDGPNFIEQDTEGNYFINPASVPNSLAGDDITFVVNGEAIEGVSTRVAKLPSIINNDDLPVYAIVEWDATGVIINIRAAHEFQAETYIQYRWIDLDNDNTEVGTTRILTNHRIESTEATITVNYQVIMSVIGLEDSCTESFTVSFTIDRPTLTIPRGICFGQSIELDVNPDDVVTTSLDNNIIQNISDTITLESGLVANNDVGTEFQIFVNGSPAATTTVYKVPEISNIDANYTVARWDGDDLLVNLTASYTVPGVSSPGSYLDVKWFDENGTPIATTTNHRIAAGGDNVDLSYRVIVCVQSALMDVDPCETTPIIVTINEDAPVPELPTDLGINDRYCWKEGDPTFSENIGISPSDFIITSPQVGSSILVQNTNSHTFRVSSVANALLGELIQFQINGTTIDTTRVYKLPSEATIAHDLAGSVWGNGFYRFRFSHTFDDKTYFNYTVVDIETQQAIPEVSRGVFEIPADNAINRRVEVSISVPGLCTTEKVTITITDIRDDGGPTDNPTTAERLNCNTAYDTRLNDLGFGTAIPRLETSFQGTPFNDAITAEVMNPLKTIVTQISKSNDLFNESISALNQINSMRDDLSTKYLRNADITSSKKSLLELDELLEIMSLELLRCVDENNNDLANVYNDMIVISNDRANDYGDATTRSTITQSYLDSFTTKDDSFKNTLTSTFTK